MANATDFFVKVGNPGSATTLNGNYTVGDTTVTVTSTTNWPTDTGIVFAIDTIGADGLRVDGTYNTYQGTVASPTSITNVSHISGSGTDRNYTAGATTRVYIIVASEIQNRLVDGLLVSHDQDGTLKADSVDVTAVIKDGIVTNAKLVNDTVEIGKLHEKTSEYLANFIYSGGYIGISSGLVGTFSNIVYYISGVRYTATSVANKTYTASKDTYVDIGTDGTVDYNEVANNAASPALAASHIRVAIIVTNGTNITVINQGETTMTSPVVSSIPYQVTDSLGNLIYPNNPCRTLLGYRQIVTTFNTSSAAAVQVTGLSCPVIVPVGRKVKITAFAQAALPQTSLTTAYLSIWDGTVGSGTQLAVGSQTQTAASYLAGPLVAEAVVLPASTTKTYNVGLASSAANSLTLQGGSTAPAFIKVELL